MRLTVKRLLSGGLDIPLWADDGPPACEGHTAAPIFNIMSTLLSVLSHLPGLLQYPVTVSSGGEKGIGGDP